MDPKIVIFCLFIILGGCTTTPVVQPTVEHVLVTPPPSLIQTCKVTPPPDRASYLASSAQDKEKMLFNLSSDLYSDLKVCNGSWATLKDWYVQQQEIYKQ